MQVGLGSKLTLGRSVAMHRASTREPHQAEANRQSTAPPAKHSLACLETASRWQVDHAAHYVASRSWQEIFRGEGCIIRSCQNRVKDSHMQVSHTLDVVTIAILRRENPIVGGKAIHAARRASF